MFSMMAVETTKDWLAGLFGERHWKINLCFACSSICLLSRRNDLWLVVWGLLGIRECTCPCNSWELGSFSKIDLKTIGPWLLPAKRNIIVHTHIFLIGRYRN